MRIVRISKGEAINDATISIKKNSGNISVFNFEKRWLTILTIINQIVFGISFLLTFLILFSNDISFSITLNSYSILIITTFFATLLFYGLMASSVKKISLNHGFVTFEYYNHKTYFELEETVTFIIQPKSNKIKVSLFDNNFTFRNAEGFSTFLEAFTRVAQLEFSENLRLNEQKEVIKYKVK